MEYFVEYSKLQHELLPFQYGVGIPCGIEIVHKIISSHLHLYPDHVAIKLDIMNAFNEISWEKIFEGATLLAPFLLPYLYTFYSHANKLTSYDRKLLFTMFFGVQQGDPLGSLLFCLRFYMILKPFLETINPELHSVC